MICCVPVAQFKCISYLNKNREEEKFILRGFNLVVLALFLIHFFHYKAGVWVVGEFLTLLWCYKKFSLLVCPFLTGLPWKEPSNKACGNAGGW